MADETKIEERENGPLVVTGLTELEGPDGPIAVKPVMALCRCGASQTKPFCDGSHTAAGFQSRDDKRAEGRDRIITYAGEELSVNFNPTLCSHAAECGRLAKHMFNPAMQPWVQPDAGTAEEVEAVVAACPSGALSLAPADGAIQHLQVDRAPVTIQRHGPYWVQGIDPPVPELAQGATPQKYVLCRCGKSGTKPFCDGSHRDAKWRDDA